jgi:(2Fe-2S) ferredoxin
MMLKKVLTAGAALVLISMIWTGSALAAEKLYVCRPCSRDFIEVAQKVIQEMELDLEVSVKTTGCLGYCEAPAVIEFRDKVYKGMDENKLRALLESTFDK